jgi:probable F420-dependent oxidoreductase
MSDEQVYPDAPKGMGRVGFWSFQLDPLSAAREREVVAEVEELGFGAIWIPEGYGSKEAFSHAGVILSATARVVVATGIASMWARDPMAMSNGARALADAYPGRFLLGIGVSHEVRATARGHVYDKPYSRMVAYLDAMDAAPAPASTPPAPRILAALGPKMLRLSAQRALGAHPYFVPVEHTAFARETLGQGPLLAPEQLVVLSEDPDEARAIGREHMSHYLSLPNYANNLRRLGWSEDEIESPSDRSVDALVAWGGAEEIRRRVREHLDAGADHVSIQILGKDAAEFPSMQLRELAPALTTL